MKSMTLQIPVTSRIGGESWDALFEPGSGGAAPDPMRWKWGWCCRTLPPVGDYTPLRDEGGAPPRVGDVALLRVESIGYHSKLVCADGRQLRLYPGDVIVGVFGNRYATAAYEGEVCGTETLHMLTNAGLVGTVRSRHQEMKAPTRLSFVDYLGDGSRRRVNVKKPLNAPPAEAAVMGASPPLIVVVGTSMNSGKTTTVAKLAKGLVNRRFTVAVCKLTGSVCPRDAQEGQATGAADVRDFSDYGFPSTYRCPPDELLSLFRVMLADAAAVDPDVVIMELADGLLQQETQFLLDAPEIARRVSGVILTATCPGSALFALPEVQRRGLPVVAVSGCMTSSPLFVREYESRATVPAAASTGAGEELTELVARHLHLNTRDAVSA